MSDLVPEVQAIRSRLRVVLVALAALVAVSIVGAVFVIQDIFEDQDTQRAIKNQVATAEYQAEVTERNVCVGAINARKDLAVVNSFISLGELLRYEGGLIPPEVVARAQATFDQLVMVQEDLQALVDAANADDQSLSPCPAPDPPDVGGASTPG